MTGSYNMAVAGGICIIMLVIIKAIISNAKAAISNINESNIRKKAEEDGDKDSLLLADLIDKPESYIFAIDILITTISVMCGYIYYAMIYDSVTNILYKAGLSIVVIVIIHIVFVFVLVLLVALFGSLIPKKLAVRNSETKAYNTIGLMMFIMKALRPVTYVLQLMMNINIRLMGINPDELNDNVTEEEIISMVNEGHEQGVLDESEVEMISNIMEFGDKEVRDIMTHRKNIIALDASMGLKEGLEFMVSQSYSRYPVYEDEIDNIIGILHIKDVTRDLVKNSESKKTLKELIKKPYFVPETQNIDLLLNNMQANKTHMAIAIDEYGQTSGLVAFEDVIEEIVGNIFDEYDEEERYIMKQSNGTIIMRGLTPLENVEKALDIEIENDNYGTLNGLLTSLIQRIPNEDEKLTIQYKGFNFEVMDVKNKMIRFVKVKRLNITSHATKTFSDK